MTILGLHDFVKVSISAEVKSFLLIMCIDVPESTTNTGKHLFSEGEKNAALFFSFNFRILLASLSLFDTDRQFLERWGYADEVHLGKSFRAKDFGLECQREVQRLL